MTTPDPWRCATCGTQYPVPALARDCEAKHRGDDQ